MMLLTKSQNTSQKNKFIGIFYVQIENEPKFKVGQRIIGEKGWINKSIIEKSTAGAENHDLKLRLRGRGIGFKE